MPTNKERKEIAAKLRETMLTEGAAIVEEREGLEPAVATRFVAIPNLIAALNFNKNIVSIRELTDRLADLIEPESERICKIEAFDNGLDEDYDGSLYSYAPPTYYLSCGHEAYYHKPNYCPDCGAKVK